jgi:death-on-curing protein
LEAALARPQNLLAYRNHKPGLSALGAAYAFGIARGHCFPDGNKRVALSTLDVFLQLNGHELTAPDTPATVDTFRALATGQLTEEQLAEWIAANSQPLPADQPISR